MTAETNKPELRVEGMPSTWKKRGLISGASLIGSAAPSVQEGFLNELDEGELRALPYLFDFWAMPHQLPPEGDWRSWVVMGGRGAGKTRAGAEWVRSAVEGPRPLDEGRCRRTALVGETIEQVREVMIFGDSGILACSPADRRPDWEATRKRLVWPNGAVATVPTAHDPEGLRGPQFDGAWVDEIAKWKKSQETWDMLQFALRLGERPQVCVTTTPRNVGVLKALLQSPSTVVTHAPTEANRAHLAASFLEEVRARYRGTRLGRQELDGVCWKTLKVRCGPVRCWRRADMCSCLCWTVLWWRWTLRPRRVHHPTNAGLWWRACNAAGRRKTGAPMCLPIVRWRAWGQAVGRGRQLPRWSDLALTVWWLRSIRAVRWCKRLSVRWTRWSHIRGFMPVVARCHAQSLWQPFMSRGGCAMWPIWMAWKTRCVA